MLVKFLWAKRFFDIFSGKLPIDLPEMMVCSCLLNLNLGSDWEVYETSYSSEKNVIFTAELDARKRFKVKLYDHVTSLLAQIVQLRVVFNALTLVKLGRLKPSR